MQGYRNEPWWKADDSDVAEAIFSHVHYLDQNQTQVRDAHLLHMRLYGNTEFSGLRGVRFTRTARKNRRGAMALNVIKSCIDTQNAKIAKNKPRPMFLTKGGNFAMRQKARKLSKFVEGIFYQQAVYRKGACSQLDSAVFGKGFAYVYVEVEKDGDGEQRRGKICIERVFPDEILVDIEEARYGAPRQMHRRKYVAREKLLEDYPEHAAEIMNASKSPDSERGVSSDIDADLIEVISSWHLPSGPGAADGKWAIAIANHVLFSDAWTLNRFPFAELPYGPALLGYWPIGLAEELTPIQREINTIVRRIAEAFRRLSNPRVWIERGSQVVKEHFTNMIAGVQYYTGTPPQVEVSATVHPEVFQHLDRLYQRAYDLSGVSRLSATSEKPSGLDSGAALREYNDVESERFAMKQRAYEDFFMDLTRLVVDTARCLKRDYGADVTINVKDSKRGVFDTINFSEVDLDDDALILQVHPTNFLPQTPAGKIQSIKELGQAIPELQPHMLHLLTGNNPDLDAIASLVTGPIEDIQRTIGLMLDEGQYHPPEPLQNLAVGVKLVLDAYLKARTEGVPEDRLDLLRNWIQDAQALLQQSAQPPASPEATPTPAGAGPQPPVGPAPATPQPPTTALPGPMQ